MNNFYTVMDEDDTEALFLINRKNPFTQFLNELVESKKSNRIRIMTYQAVEAVIRSGEQFNLKKYKYIFCDEYHRFSTDTTVDKYTDLVLDAVMNSGVTRIFLSATPSGVDEYIKEELYSRGIYYTTYVLPPSYKMMDIQLFYGNQIDSIIERVKSQHCKAIVFSNNLDMLSRLYQEHQSSSMFVCSEYNKGYTNLVDDKLKQYMIKHEKLPVQFLFASTCLDIGFNLNDSQIKYVICSLDDIDQIIQCIGRRRIQGLQDKFHVYIKGLSRAEMKTSICKWEQKIEKVKYLEEFGDVAFINQYRYDRRINIEDDLIYAEVSAEGQPTLKPFRLGQLYFQHRIDRFQDILNSNLPYLDYLKQFFGCSAGVRIGNEKTDARYNYLKSLVGQPIIGKKAQKEVYRTLNYWDKDRNIVRSVEGLNKCLQADALPFVIVESTQYNPVTRGISCRWDVHYVD